MFPSNPYQGHMLFAASTPIRQQSQLIELASWSASASRTSCWTWNGGEVLLRTPLHTPQVIKEVLLVATDFQDLSKPWHSITHYIGIFQNLSHIFQTITVAADGFQTGLLISLSIVYLLLDLMRWKSLCQHCTLYFLPRSKTWRSTFTLTRLKWLTWSQIKQELQTHVCCY